MRLSELLTNGTRLYIDTAPLIYYIEEHPTYLVQMESIINAIDEGIVADNRQLEKQYRDILLHSGAYHLLSINQEIAADAATLRSRYNLRTLDALPIMVPCILPNFFV